MPGWEPLCSSNRQTFHHQEYVDAGAPSDVDAGVQGRDADADVQVSDTDADAYVQGSDADAQAEKRRQSGLPWLLVTALMIAAQIVGASLAATDFGTEYNVNDDD